MSTVRIPTTAEHDAEDDVLFVAFTTITPGMSSRQTMLDDGRRILDHDRDGKVIGVEVLFASEGFSLDGLPHPEAVRAAAASVGITAR
jgi:uncharacterized protein YuzE